MSHGIYWIRNTVNGKFYIRSSRNVNKRWQTHRSFLNNRSHSNAHLQNSWNAYGADAFQFQILEPVNDPNDLEPVEQWYLDNTRCLDRRHGYNIEPLASCGAVSEETRRKMSEARKGRPISPERLENLRLSNLGRKQTPEWISRRVRSRRNGSGYAHSDETRQKMSEQRRGNPAVLAHIYKLIDSNRGKPSTKTQDQRRMLGDLNRGKPAWNRGKKASDETRRRQSEGIRKACELRKSHRTTETPT